MTYTYKLTIFHEQQLLSIRDGSAGGWLLMDVVFACEQNEV